MEKFVFDVISQTLTITAKFAKMMNDPQSDEYKLVQQFRKDFPNLTIAKKTHKSATHYTTKSKRTYEGMDFKFMEDYIATFEDVSLAKEYEAVKQMAEDCGTKAYPLTKKWFLGKFSDMEGGFNMDEAKKDIADFRIAKAQASILEVVSAAAEQNENAA